MSALKSGLAFTGKEKPIPKHLPAYKLHSLPSSLKHSGYSVVKPPQKVGRRRVSWFEDNPATHLSKLEREAVSRDYENQRTNESVSQLNFFYSSKNTTDLEMHVPKLSQSLKDLLARSRVFIKNNVQSLLPTKSLQGIHYKL